MKLFLRLAMTGVLLCGPSAIAGQVEFDLCQGKSENTFIQAANCDLAIRMGGLATDQMIVALFNRGQAYLTSQKPALALEDFDALLKLAPTDKETLFTRGIAYRQLKQYDAAIADFNRLLELKYEPAAKIYLQRSMAYHMTGDKEKTLADLRQAKALDPNDGIIADRLWKTERLYAQQGQ